MPLPPTAPSTVRGAPVERCTSNAHLDECATTFWICSSRRALLHHDDHGSHSPLFPHGPGPRVPFVARRRPSTRARARRASSMIVRTAASIASPSSGPALTRAGRARARPLRAPAGRSRMPSCFFSRPISQRAGGALVEQPTSCSSSTSIRSRSSVERRLVRRSLPLSQRTKRSTPSATVGDCAGVGDDLDERAARPPPRRPSGRPRGRAPGREMPKPSATGSASARASARPAPRAPSATSSRAPVTPRREMPYRNPRPSSAACRIRSSVVVGLTRKIGVDARGRPAVRGRPGLLDRQIERPARRRRRPAAAARANASTPIRRIGLA